MSEDKILVFSPVYLEGDPMRYRVIDKKFLKTCRDVESWIPLSEEVFTRPYSKPEQDCKSFCKLFAKAQLKEAFWKEHCEICKSESAIYSTPYKWDDFDQVWGNADKDFGPNIKSVCAVVFDVARERKEKEAMSQEIPLCPFCGKLPSLNLCMTENKNKNAKLATCRTPGCPMYHRAIPLPMWGKRANIQPYKWATFHEWWVCLPYMIQKLMQGADIAKVIFNAARERKEG